MLGEEGGELQDELFGGVGAEQNQKAQDLFDLGFLDHIAREAVAYVRVIAAQRVKLVEQVLPQQHFQPAAVHVSLVDVGERLGKVGVRLQIHHDLGNALTVEQVLIVALLEPDAELRARLGEHGERCG